MTPTPETQSLNSLSDALHAATPDRVEIQRLLDTLKVEHPDVYERLKDDNNSVVHQAEDHLRDLRNDVEGMVVPGFILANPDARANMEAFGSIRDGVFIPENDEIKRDFEEYKDLMGFIENTPRNQTQSIIDMEGLVSRYEKLLAPTNSRFIRGADYLTAMYGEALYEDIIARGFIHKRDGDRREYEIVCPEMVNGVYEEKDLADAFPNHPYLRLLKRVEVNDMMDMMAVGSIMVKDRISYRSMDLVGQDDLIKTILAKHNIKGPDGRDILNPQLLLVHWETPSTVSGGLTVKDQVLAERNKLVENKDDGGSWQGYQELQYILDFMENEDYLDTDRSLNMYQFANQYRLAYLAKQAYVGTGGPAAGTAGEKNIMDHIAEFAKGNTVAGLGIAFVAWLTGHGKTAMFATIFALLGGKLADAGSDIMNEGKEYASSWTKEQLGILDPQDVRYNIKTPAGIEETDIQAQLDALFVANEGARDTGGVNNNVLNGTLSNAKIAKVYQSILANDAILAQGYTTDAATVAAISAAIGSPAQVTAGDFDSIVPASELGPISDADILAAITLMGNTIKEDSDTSFGDMVFSGIDPLKQPYSPIEFGFYGDSSADFEGTLNTILSNARSGATTRVEVGEIAEVKSTLSGIFVGEGIGDISEITQRIHSTLLLNESQEASEALQTLSLIPSASLTIGGIDYKTPLMDAITSYRGYAEVDDVLSQYDGNWATVEGAADKAMNKIELFAARRIGINLTNIDDADDAIAAIDEELLIFADPTLIKVAQGTRTVDITTAPEYAPLLDRFNEIKLRLEREKSEFETLRINIINGTIAGLGGNPNTLTPAEQSDYQNKFNNAEITELQGIATEVGTLARTIEQGNVNSPSNLPVYIDTYGSAFAKLAGIQTILSGVTLQAAGTPELILQQAILDSIDDTLTTEGATLKTSIESELIDAFAQLKDVQDRLGAISITGATTITELKTHMTVVTAISGSLSSFVDGTFDGARNNQTIAEKAFAKAEEVFGAAPTIANSSITGRQLFESSEELIKQITDRVHTLAINSTTSLDDLVAMYESGLIEKAHDVNPSLGLKEDVKRSIEIKITAHIASLSTVDAIVDYTEGDYEGHRAALRWSYEGLTGDLDVDEELADKLKEKLTDEIAALTANTSGLTAAKALATKMSWLPAQSTAGRWRTVLQENFTDFTGFFPESDLKQDYDAKLEDIRIAVKNSAPDSGSNLYSTLNDIARDNATSNGPLSNVAQEYRDGSGGATINTLMSDADFKDRPDIIGALQNDYIID